MALSFFRIGSTVQDNNTLKPSMGAQKPEGIFQRCWETGTAPHEPQHNVFYVLSARKGIHVYLNTHISIYLIQNQHHRMQGMSGSKY